MIRIKRDKIHTKENSKIGLQYSRRREENLDDQEYDDYSEASTSN